ncbi:MAG: hypothetical protein MUF21_10905 [Gemmatimonadaceae bacterium]|nr:hypothetical protein [Gemmatimonadaceae bacterium]
MQVGGGAMYSRLRQSGDFRFDDNSIETAEFRSSGWAPTAYGAAGVDIGITSRSSLVLDARYSWARERLRGDFDGFAPLDLSSLALTAGFAWRF